MEKIDKVSIWVCRFNNDSELQEYIKEEYNEDGDITSNFMNDFNIDYIDNQFQEVLFLESMNNNNNNNNDLINPLSYSETFISNINIPLTYDINAVIAIYDFEYEEEVQSKNQKFYLGSYSYDK